MKNIFKFMGIALVAGSMLVACGPDDPEDETTYTITVNSNDNTLGTASIEPNKAEYNNGETVTITATPSSNATFQNWNGSITDNPYTFTVTGDATYTANFQAKPQSTWSLTFDGSALDVSGFSDWQTNGQGTILLQCASSAEGNSVYFPYFVAWLSGTSTSNLAVNEQGGVELYKDTYYTAGEDQYGDWQYYSTNNMNCTVLDMTANTLSFTMALTMYNLGNIVDGTASEPSDCEQKSLGFTGNNLNLTVVSGKKGMKKMNVVK